MLRLLSAARQRGCRLSAGVVSGAGGIGRAVTRRAGRDRRRTSPCLRTGPL